MLNYSHVNNQYLMFLTPIAPVAADLPFHELPYSPALLLPLPALSSVLVCDPDFAAFCQVGYDAYFEESFNNMDENLPFKPKQYTFAEVSLELRKDFACLPAGEVSLSAWAGLFFGWLSALSKYHPAPAQTGVCLLVSLVNTRSEVA